jgi:RsbT co-antagonist protein rsbRD N-terminal domain
MNKTKVANAIEAHLDQLIESWSQTVRDDPRIESDAKLSKPELIDHVPAIIQEICALIRNGETPDVHNSHEARANVYTRFHQGYQGRDLVRELSLLRITLLDYLTALASDESLGIDDKSRHQAATILNLYLDEEMRFAISIYSHPQNGSQPESPHA